MTLVVELFVVTFALIGHGYLWIAPVNRLHALPGPRWLVDLATLLCVLLFLVLPTAVLFFGTQLDLGNLSGGSWSRGYGLRGYVLLCACWGTAKLLLFNPLERRGRDNRRTLLAATQTSIDLRPHLGDQPLRGFYPRLLGLVPGNQILRLTVDQKKLVIPRLDPQLEGLVIAHLSDFHMTGRVEKRWFDLLTEEVNRREPDLIAITGDIIDSETCWSWLADSLGKLRAKHGVYFIFGNHDFYVDRMQTKQRLTDAGLVYLGGQCVETDCGAPVQLIGNERPWAPEVADFPKRPAAESPLRIALLHTPDQLDCAIEQGADLALAGHTHDGQIRIPLLGAVACPSRYGTRYAGGVFRHGDTVLHVTRGLSGKTPLRWDCPPEIALLELVRSG